MIDWKKYKFCDVIDINPTVSLKNNEKYSFVEMKDLTNEKRYCEPSDEKKLAGGSRFQNGDTLFARITPCLENGKICQVRKLKNSIGFGSTEFLVFRGKYGFTDNDFVFYLSRSDLIRSYAEQGFDGTSGRQRVPKSTIENLQIEIPPLSEQRAIATVLSSLDDKIDLLHRQNKTLEAMAETIFRQWFVEEAEDEWDEKSLITLIQIVGGGTPKTSISTYWNGDILWLAGGDIASNHKSFVFDTEKAITEEGLNKSSTKLLPKYSTVISARGTVGKYCLLGKPMAFSQSNYGILPKIEHCHFFTYLLINHVVEELQASAYGCVFDTITTTTFKEIRVPIPSEIEIQSFENSVSFYFQKMLMNKVQIRTLEKLRDTLLPKLMSGEVRVNV